MRLLLKTGLYLVLVFAALVPTTTIAEKSAESDLESVEAWLRHLHGHYHKPFYGTAEAPKKSAFRQGERAYKGFILRPLYSHHYLKKGDKEYSVWTVRPVLWRADQGKTRDRPSSAFVRDPAKPYSSDRKILFGEKAFSSAEAEKAFWDEHEAQTKTLMGHMRGAIGEVYAGQGYFDTPEKAAKQNEIFDRIFSGMNPLISITEKDNPANVYQQVAIVLNEGDGLPVDQELEAMGSERLPQDRIEVRHFPAIPNDGVSAASPESAPKIDNSSKEPYLLERAFVSGEKLEIKALMKAKDSPEDFLAVLLKQAIASNLLESSLIEMPNIFSPITSTTAAQLAFYEWTRNPIGYTSFAPYTGDFKEFAVTNGYSWLLEPILSETVRNTRAYVSTHSKGIERLYVSGLGFEPEAVRVARDAAGHEMKVLTTDIAKLQTETFRRATARGSSQWLEGAEIRPAETDIAGKARPFVQLETFAQGRRREILKDLAPRAEELIAAYHAKIFSPKSQEHEKWLAEAQARKRKNKIDPGTLEYRSAKITVDASSPALAQRPHPTHTLEKFRDDLKVPDRKVHAAYDADNPRMDASDFKHVNSEWDRELQERWLRFAGDRKIEPGQKIKVVEHLLEKADSGAVRFKLEVEFPEGTSASAMNKLRRQGSFYLELLGQDEGSSRKYHRQVPLRIEMCDGRRCSLVPTSKGKDFLSRSGAFVPLGRHEYDPHHDFKGIRLGQEKIFNITAQRPYRGDSVKAYFGWPEPVKAANPCDGPLARAGSGSRAE
jgi:hypothetical protein